MVFRNPQSVHTPIYATSLFMAVESGDNNCFNSKFISLNEIEMKKIFSIILLVILCKNSDAQIFKSFDCVKSYEDSLISVYSVRIKLEQQLDNNRRLNIVRTELKKHFQIQSDMILQIETLGSKKYRTYQYRVVVAKKNITDTLKYFDNMGKDNSPFLNDYEAEYFNLRFQGIDFDFTDKKVFFFGPEGLVFSDKQRYFDEFTRHTFIQSSLYIFDKLEKERSGGFDAVIVYWSKRNYTKDDIIKRLKEKK